MLLGCIQLTLSPVWLCKFVFAMTIDCAYSNMLTETDCCVLITLFIIFSFFQTKIHCIDENHEWLTNDAKDPMRTFFTARRTCSAYVYSAVCAMARCPSVCLSQTGVLSKRLNGSSWFSSERLHSPDSTLCFKGIRASSKPGYFLLEPWPNYECIADFAKACRPSEVLSP